jgi:hypothetical protein
MLHFTRSKLHRGLLVLGSGCWSDRPSYDEMNERMMNTTTMFARFSNLTSRVWNAKIHLHDACGKSSCVQSTCLLPLCFVIYPTMDPKCSYFHYATSICFTDPVVIHHYIHSSPWRDAASPFFRLPPFARPSSGLQLLVGTLTFLALIHLSCVRYIDCGSDSLLLHIFRW